jgi:hypothetical protein
MMCNILPSFPNLKFWAGVFQVFARVFPHQVDGHYHHCGSKSCSYSDDPRLN